MAQVLVRRHPERVDRLVLSHTGIRHLAGRRPMQLLAIALAALPERLVRAVLWRVWMRLFSVPADERLFWTGLLRAVIDRLESPTRWHQPVHVRFCGLSAHTARLGGLGGSGSDP